MYSEVKAFHSRYQDHATRKNVDNMFWFYDECTKNTSATRVQLLKWGI